MSSKIGNSETVNPYEVVDHKEVQDKNIFTTISNAATAIEQQLQNIVSQTASSTPSTASTTVASTTSDSSSTTSAASTSSTDASTAVGSASTSTSTTAATGTVADSTTTPATTSASNASTTSTVSSGTTTTSAATTAQNFIHGAAEVLSEVASLVTPVTTAVEAVISAVHTSSSTTSSSSSTAKQNKKDKKSSKKSSKKIQDVVQSERKQDSSSDKPHHHNNNAASSGKHNHHASSSASDAKPGHHHHNNGSSSDVKPSHHNNNAGSASNKPNKPHHHHQPTSVSASTSVASSGSGSSPSTASITSANVADQSANNTSVAQDSSDTIVDSTSNSSDSAKSAKKRKASTVSSSRQRALLIGLNYKGTSHSLSGCIKDVTNVRTHLLANWGFAVSDIVVLVDEPTSFSKANVVPTKANILKAFSDLVSWAKAALAQDSSSPVRIFVQYSGHGTDVVDTSGDEADGRDEALVPSDYNTAGFLIDDQILSSFIQPLGAVDSGRNLIDVFALIDACRSGTICDLPLNVSTSQANAFRYANVKAWKASKSNLAAYLKSYGILPKMAALSGCRDDQYSTDMGQKGGALTSTLIDYLASNPNPTWLQVVSYLDTALKKYSQAPDLSTSFALDTSKPFGKVLEIVSKPSVTGDSTKSLYDDDTSDVESDDDSTLSYNDDQPAIDDYDVGEQDANDVSDQEVDDTDSDQEEDQDQEIEHEDDEDSDTQDQEADEDYDAQDQDDINYYDSYNRGSTVPRTSPVLIARTSKNTPTDYIGSLIKKVGQRQDVHRITVIEFRRSDERKAKKLARKIEKAANKEIVTQVTRPTAAQGQQIVQGLQQYYKGRGRNGIVTQVPKPTAAQGQQIMNGMTAYHNAGY